jgi:hypothetical protein
MSPYYVSGENIWAQSVISSMEEFGFTRIYSFKKLDELKEDIHNLYGGWDGIEMIITSATETVNCGNNNTCFYSKKENPNGIKLWKTLAFHFWGSSMHPLGGDWVLNPEVFDGNNQYLGYSVEKRCKQAPYIKSSYRYGSMTKTNALEKSSKHAAPPSQVEKHRRVAYVLAKKLSYFATIVKNGVQIRSPAFGQEQFDAAYERLNIRFEIGSLNDSKTLEDASSIAYTNDASRFQNHDNTPPDLFPRILSTASILIGLGDPQV